MSSVNISQLNRIYVNTPLKLIVPFIDDDILQKITFDHVNLGSLLKFKNDFNNDKINFGFVINHVNVTNDDLLRVYFKIANFENMIVSGQLPDIEIYYITVRKILNFISSDYNLNISYDLITKFTDFPGTILTSINTIKILEAHVSDIFIYSLDRNDFNWNSRMSKRPKHNDYGYVISLLRNLTKKCGFFLSYKSKPNSYGDTEQYYSIVFKLAKN